MMRTLIALLLLTFAFAVRGATIDNDDSCDVAVFPAATLLLPYFEVDITSVAGTGETTIFSVTNVTNLAQAVQVTLWTDYAYPVMTFNIFLTGYDVQSINLYDVIRRGLIAPDDGTGFDVSYVGELSGDLFRGIPFDNPQLDEVSCIDLPVQLPQTMIRRMQSAFTTGKAPAAGSSGACNSAGGVHTNAVGYATIDVVGRCSNIFPNDLAYFADVIRWDNVLFGEYLQINGNEDYAQGGAMTHIRAIPEGGTPAQRRDDPAYATTFEHTFYGRLQAPATPKLDGRQPLPGVWTTRWIAGGAADFQTHFKIWRESTATFLTMCSSRPATGGNLPFLEVVLFDEDENPETLRPGITPKPIVSIPTLPATSMPAIGNTAVFPERTTGAVGGWMYLNLAHDAADTLTRQSWVVTSMRAEDRYSTDTDATALGNGCSAPAGLTNVNGGSHGIGPLPNTRP